MFQPLPIPEVEHAHVNGVKMLCDNRCAACNRPVRIFPHKKDQETTCPHCKTRMVVQVADTELGIAAAWMGIQ